MHGNLKTTKLWNLFFAVKEGDLCGSILLRDMVLIVLNSLRHKNQKKNLRKLRFKKVVVKKTESMEQPGSVVTETLKNV